jgi:hypothetical protein
MIASITITMGEVVVALLVVIVLGAFGWLRRR